MSGNLKDIDPAIVDSSGTKKPRGPRAPIAQGVKQAPSFPPTSFVVEPTEDGSDFLNFNPATHAVVKAADGKFVAIPRSAKVPGLALKDGKDTVEFPYSSATLIAVNHWVEKYGAEGESPAKFPTPVTHIDFHTLLNDDWDKFYFDEVLQDSTGDAGALFGTINFAEKHQLNGLLSFVVVALSCLIRGKDDSQVLHVFNQPEAVKDAVDEREVNAKYPWLAAAISTK